MKISVVVPMYNAERYIQRCIRSVQNQTYGNWELIIVDDGSVDSSSLVVGSMAESDGRIRVLHQENAGPGQARNYGIKEATGDYIVFIDSDDFVDSDYFALLTQRDEDVVFIDVKQVTNDGRVIKNEKMSCYREWSLDRLIRSQMTGKIPWGGCRKAVRSEILKQHQIEFTYHCIGEEALYSFKILNAARTVGFIDTKNLYYYVNHQNSQSKLITSDPWGDIVVCLKHYFTQHDLYDQYADSLNALNVTATVVSLDRINCMYHDKQIRVEAATRLDKFFALYDRCAGIDYKNMSYKAKFFTPFLLSGCCQPVMFCSKLRSALCNSNI